MTLAAQFPLLPGCPNNAHSYRGCWWALTSHLCRLNSAPVRGFEKDVGSKTTLRITYPEGAMQRPEQYERDSLFVLAGFKWQDFRWLKYIVYKERVVSGPSPACLASSIPQSNLG